MFETLALLAILLGAALGAGSDTRSGTREAAPVQRPEPEVAPEVAPEIAPEIAPRAELAPAPAPKQQPAPSPAPKPAPEAEAPTPETPTGRFTTAGEVRPILEATRPGWIAVREFDGADLLYFTHIEAWRCGLSEVLYSVNGGPEQRWEMEPCYLDEAQPNAIKAEGRLPFVRLPLGSVETVELRLRYDDGAWTSARYDRRGVLLP